MKATQLFSEEYLDRCAQMSTAEIVRFLDDYRRIYGKAKGKSKLISLKVPEDLLAAFRFQARLENIPYQTKIKALMRDYLTTERSN